VEFLEEDVTALTEKDGVFTVTLEGGRTVTGRAVILAMGISRKKLV
jgi:thioredoxin reductase